MVSKIFVSFYKKVSFAAFRENLSINLSIMKTKSFLALFLFTASLPMASALQAQTACSDALCMSASDLLKESYVKDLNQSFAEAHSIAAVSAMPYIGKVRVDHITVGAQGIFGIRTKIDEDIETDGIEISNLTQPTGAVVYGSYFAGVNIGGLLNWFGVVTNLLGLPSFAALDNFDILVAHSDAEDFLKFGGVKYSFETAYAGIRYQLIPGAGLPILGGWKGIVFGIGYLSSTVRFSELSDDVDNISIDTLELRAEQEKFTLESTVNSVPLELNTGVEILFLNVTAGAGVLLNTGKSKLQYERKGQALDESGADLGPLALELEDEIDPPSSVFYYKMGLEFPILPFVRLGGEASYGTKGAYSYAFAMRISL